jgi:hypothetical protein
MLKLQVMTHETNASALKIGCFPLKKDEAWV